MCGIVGAASAQNVVPLLIDGIRRLEYRGYDSTGLAIIGNGVALPHLERLVTTARVADLAAQADAKHLKGFTGTTWPLPRRLPHLPHLPHLSHPPHQCAPAPAGTCPHRSAPDRTCLLC